jgi:hypothetical protein
VQLIVLFCREPGSYELAGDVSPDDVPSMDGDAQNAGEEARNQESIRSHPALGRPSFIGNIWELPVF